MASTLNTFMQTFNNKVEQPVRQHLTNVYACLAASTISAAAGAGLHLYTEMFRAGFMSTIGALACFIMLLATGDVDGKKVQQRVGYLLGFSLLSGMGMGPLLEYAVAVDPSIVVTALIGTSVIFVSFSLCSIFSEEGRWIYFGGTLMTMINTLVILSIANIFLGSQLLFKAHLYIGLAMMCGFILYDTQLIIEKRRMGNKDFVTHSLDLFIDLIGVFRRLVILLTQKEDRRQRRDD